MIFGNTFGIFEIEVRLPESSEVTTIQVSLMPGTYLVQYILLRSDLASRLGWPLGAIVAQGCHASTAALHRFRDHVDTKAYLEDIEHMHKVVLAIEESELSLMADKLTGAGVDFVAWREQPENILTAFALRPYTKKDVQSYFKGMRLLS
uniref:peptidyl-tRNA hydrolase n=1 Tax=Schistocephalus solidus TaxID=70667 RepID=A0A0X3Q7R7_SCHSO